MDGFPKQTVNHVPIAGGGGVDTICTTVCLTAVTAPPCVDRVVWSHYVLFTSCFDCDNLYKKCMHCYIMMIKRFNIYKSAYCFLVVVYQLP